MYDVVIVGSGFGGSIPALRLAQDGRSVLLLEQGERLTARDYKQDWSLRNMDRLFVNYMSDEYEVFFRYGRGLGGGSLTYAAACLRAPTEVFAYEDRSGYTVWPDVVDRAVMDPYYAMAEEMMQVTQTTWEEVPGVGGAFAHMLDNIGHTCDRSRYPMVDCQQCGYCMVGCKFDKKVTLAHSYIPQAEELGVEVQTRCQVRTVRPTADGYAATYLDPYGRTVEAEGRLLILAASALETPAILLRSVDDLPEMSEQVGKNLNNNGDVALMFHLPEDFPRYNLYMGRNNAGMMCYSFWDEHQITIHPGAGSPALFGALEVQADGDGGEPAHPLGMEFKQFIKDNFPHRLISALAIGLIDPGGEVFVDSSGLLKFRFPMTAYLAAYIERVASVGREIAAGSDARLLRTNDTGWEHGDAHPLGTCRIGDDPAKAPCDPYGELRGYPGLFVTDGASIPGGTGVNPALTIAANAERIAAHIVENR